MLSFAVIGSGIVGSSLAYHLARGGARVTVIDRAEPGGGTTARSFAWLNANNKTPRAYFDLNLDGMRAHRSLSDEPDLAGIGGYTHWTGNLIWAGRDGEAALRQRVERLQHWGYAAVWLDAATTRTTLAPHLTIADPDAPVAHFAGEGWADAPGLTACLVDAAVRHGASLRVGTDVVAIDTTGGHLTGITLAGGERIAVDVVVNAAGAGAAAVSRLAGVPLPMAPTRGLLVRLALAGAPAGPLLHALDVNIRPDGLGRVLLHHDGVDTRLGDRDEVSPADPLVRDLVAAATRVVPALAAATTLDARVGVRPITADGHPSAGPLSALPGYVEAVTHSGVTLGPLLGHLLATEVLTGDRSPLLTTFHPDRFSRI